MVQQDERVGATLAIALPSWYIENGEANMTDKISLLITDDHALVRQGTRAFLELQPDITVIGEAGSGEEAVRMAA